MNHWPSRAVLQSIDDSGPLQLADFTGYANQAYAGMHRMQQFGFSCVPLAGAHGIILPQRGQHGLAVLLGGEHGQYRPTGRVPGAPIVYDQWGNKIDFGQNVKTISHSTKIHLVVGNMLVAISPNRIDLGADPAPNAVMTTAGASTKVFSV